MALITSSMQENTGMYNGRDEYILKQSRKETAAVMSAHYLCRLTTMGNSENTFLKVTSWL